MSDSTYSIGDSENCQSSLELGNVLTRPVMHREISYFPKGVRIFYSEHSLEENARHRHNMEPCYLFSVFCWYTSGS
jgi:hypothetical protein